MDDVEILISKLYQQDQSKLIAVLVRIFGPQNYQLAEDVLQESFAKALIQWKSNGAPDNPSGWLVRVAKNKAIDAIRRHKASNKYANDLKHQLESEWSLADTINEEFDERHIKDDQLRLLFLCCATPLKPEQTLTLALKALAGFSVEQISKALLTPIETIKKRLTRAKRTLAKKDFEIPKPSDVTHALGSVHTTLYLIFNEGFFGPEPRLNAMMCQSAMGLVGLILEAPTIANKDTIGLLAWMHFQTARVPSIRTKEGFHIPINLQDRSLWSKRSIETGRDWLKLGEQIKTSSPQRYWIEANIALSHCQAKSFDDTNWQKIEALYKSLYEVTQSPLAKLHVAIAMSYAGRIDGAISIAKTLLDEPRLKTSHAPCASLAHFYAMKMNREKAYHFAQLAKAKGGTPHEHQLMFEQIERHLKTG